MSDLLDDFIAFLEQDDTLPEETPALPTTSHVEEYDDTDIPLDGCEGSVDLRDNADVPAVPTKGFAFGAVKSKQEAYKSGLPYGGSRNENSSDNTATMEFMGIRITRAAVTAETVNSLTAGKRVIKVSEIPFHVNRLKKEIEGDWVTGGVVIDRQSFSSKKTGKLFTILKLSDLRETSKYVSLFLFGEVHESFENLSVASVIGLLNVSLMPSNQENGKSRKSGGKKQNNCEEICALRLDHPLKLLRLGFSLDFGRCQAQKVDGNLCNAVINKSLAKTCVFHVNREYRKVVTARPDLKATYAGIIPNSEAVEIQQTIVDNHFALLGPGGVSSKATEKIKAQIVKSAEDMRDKNAEEKASSGPSNEDEAIAFLKAQKQARVERKEKLQKELELRKQLEAEMIADAVRNPLTLAARNMVKLQQIQKNGGTTAKGHMDDEEEGMSTVVVKRKKQSESSRVNLSQFTAADEIFSKLKPVRQEIISAARPLLARGSGPGSNVFLDLDKDVAKQTAALPHRRIHKPQTLTPFEMMNVRRKNRSDVNQLNIRKEEDDDEVQVIPKMKSSQQPATPVIQKRIKLMTSVAPENPEPVQVSKPINAAKKRKLDAIANRVQGSMTAPDDAV